MDLMFLWHFNLRDDKLLMAYAKVHVAPVIRASGYKKSSKNISNPNFNLQ